ncbi:hypothetical protein J6590_058540 [Homalodisca vitripennis]|nr:hypothetical protein J6590_058540 [Homalodisca vitripennis]
MSFVCCDTEFSCRQQKYALKQAKAHFATSHSGADFFLPDGELGVCASSYNTLQEKIVRMVTPIRPPAPDTPPSSDSSPSPSPSPPLVRHRSSAAIARSALRRRRHVAEEQVTPPRVPLNAVAPAGRGSPPGSSSSAAVARGAMRRRGRMGGSVSSVESISPPLPVRSPPGALLLPVSPPLGLSPRDRPLPGSPPPPSPPGAPLANGPSRIAEGEFNAMAERVACQIHPWHGVGRLLGHSGGTGDVTVAGTEPLATAAAGGNSTV